MTNSVGWMDIFLPLILTDAFLLSSQVPTSAWESLCRFTMDENDLNSSQYVRKMTSNRWNICFFSVYWVTIVEVEQSFYAMMEIDDLSFHQHILNGSFAVHCHTTVHST